MPCEMELNSIKYIYLQIQGGNKYEKNLSTSYSNFDAIKCFFW